MKFHHTLTKKEQTPIIESYSATETLETLTAVLFSLVLGSNTFELVAVSKETGAKLHIKSVPESIEEVK